MARMSAHPVTGAVLEPAAPAQPGRFRKVTTRLAGLAAGAGLVGVAFVGHIPQASAAPAAAAAVSCRTASFTDDRSATSVFKIAFTATQEFCWTNTDTEIYSLGQMRVTGYVSQGASIDGWNYYGVTSGSGPYSICYTEYGYQRYYCNTSVELQFGQGVAGYNLLRWAPHIMFREFADGEAFATDNADSSQPSWYRI